MNPDICYSVRPGDHNEELRYSLRSLRNLPHGRVWIAGHKPPWVSDLVGHIPTLQGDPRTSEVKFANSRRNHRALAEHDEIADDIVLFNDDFFVTEPIDRVPVLHYGTIENFNAFFRARSSTVSSYMLAERYTCEWVTATCGIARPRSYALHVPLPVAKQALADVLAILPETYRGLPLHLRTALGNLARLGGRRVADVKVLRSRPMAELARPFASTSDGTFRMGAGEQLRSLFPDPGPYEA